MHLARSLVILSFIFLANAHAWAAEPVKTTPPAGADLKLLDPGTGPKQVYRYTFTANKEYKTEMDLILKVKVREGERNQPGQSLPIMRIGMTIRTGKILADGSAETTYEFTNSKVIPNNPAEEQVAGAIAAELQAIQGLTGKGIVAPNGLVKDLKYSMKSGSNSQLPKVFENIQHTMQQVATTLPEEPIGAGAQWELRSAVDADGIKLQQITRYTLVSVKGNILKLKVKLSQHANQQLIEKAGIPEGLILTLDSFKGEGSGDMTLDLTAPLAESFSKLKIETRMNVVHQGNSQAIESVLDTQSEFRRLKTRTP